MGLDSAAGAPARRRTGEQDMTRIVVPGRVPVALAQAINGSAQDALLSACPDLRALTMSRRALARPHVLYARFRLRDRRIRSAE